MNRVLVWARPVAGAAVWLSLGVLLTSCLYDPSHVCGSGLVIAADGSACVCAAGSALVDRECVACGKNEQVGPAGCECATGYVRFPEGNCEKSAIGAACDPAAPTCSAPFDHCEPAAGAGGEAGYCTVSGCSGPAACEAGYACNFAAVCERPPLGLNAPCADDEDCAGTEATFCDLNVHACQVVGCELALNDCFPGFVCCDNAVFGAPAPECVPAGYCFQ